MIYFYIKKTFTGKVIIPETLVAKLYGTISRDTPIDYSQPMAGVYIRGDITAPQSCEINSLRPIDFDFKEIPAADFSSVVGSTVTTHKITKTVTVECVNLGILNTDDISTSFYATEPSTDNSMVVTSNPGVGIKIYDKIIRKSKSMVANCRLIWGQQPFMARKSVVSLFLPLLQVSLAIAPLQVYLPRQQR